MAGKFIQANQNPALRAHVRHAREDAHNSGRGRTLLAAVSIAATLGAWGLVGQYDAQVQAAAQATSAGQQVIQAAAQSTSDFGLATTGTQALPTVVPVQSGATGSSTGQSQSTLGQTAQSSASLQNPAPFTITRSSR